MLAPQVQVRESTEGAVAESFLELCKPESNRSTKLQVSWLWFCDLAFACASVPGFASTTCAVNAK